MVDIFYSNLQYVWWHSVRNVSPVVPGAYVPYYYINVLNKVFNAFC